MNHLLPSASKPPEKHDPYPPTRGASVPGKHSGKTAGSRCPGRPRRPAGIRRVERTQGIPVRKPPRCGRQSIDAPNREPGSRHRGSGRRPAQKAAAAARRAVFRPHRLCRRRPGPAGPLLHRRPFVCRWGQPRAADLRLAGPGVVAVLRLRTGGGLVPGAVGRSNRRNPAQTAVQDHGGPPRIRARTQPPHPGRRVAAGTEPNRRRPHEAHRGYHPARPERHHPQRDGPRNDYPGRGRLRQNLGGPAPDRLPALPVPRHPHGQRRAHPLAQPRVCRLHCRRTARTGRRKNPGNGHAGTGCRCPGKPLQVSDVFRANGFPARRARRGVPRTDRL